MMFIRVLYGVFLGILVALFVAWAMAAWYPTPQWETEYPGIEQHMSEPYPPKGSELEFLTPDERAARLEEYEASRAAYEEWDAQYDARQRELKEKREVQGRTVALVSLLIAVIVTAGSLLYAGRLQAITEGLLLGGIFTLIYSIGWSFARSPKFAVVTVGIGLVVTIIIGYLKFVRKPAA